MGHTDRAASIYKQAVDWAPYYQPAQKALALLKQRLKPMPKLATVSGR
jgi:hypothetical protein